MSRDLGPNDPPTGLPPGFDSLPDSLRRDIYLAQCRLHAAAHLGVDPTTLPLILSPAPTITGRLACGLDLFSALEPHPTILLTVLSFLRAADVLTMYTLSRPIKRLFDSHMLSSITFLLRRMAPGTAQWFPWHLYRPLTQRDPAGRTASFSHQAPGAPIPPPPPPSSGRSRSHVRIVPSLRWFQMVAERHVRVQQITGLLARMGHRTPRGMQTTLKKLWLLNDAATNRIRRHFITQAALWTDVDLYNAQLFVVKLALVFRDPVYGPHSDAFVRFLLGQKGLYAVWAALFRWRYTTMEEVMAARAHYDLDAPAGATVLGGFNVGVWGVSPTRMGRGHLEGWGAGPSTSHLLRIDELLPEESARRQLGLHRHLEAMML